MRNEVINQSLFRNAVNALPDDMLSAVRATAAARFANESFPGTKTEDWKYTNLDVALKISNLWLSDTSMSDKPLNRIRPSILGGVDACWIVIENGVLAAQEQPLPAGISMHQLGFHASDVSILSDDAMTRFNAALLKDALHVIVDADVNIEKPIGILLVDYAFADHHVTQNRVIVDVGRNSDVSIIEAHYSYGDGECFSNSVVQLNLDESSIVDYLKFQQRSPKHVSVGRLASSIARKATFRHCSIDLGGALVRNDVSATLDGVDSIVHLNGLCLAGDQQHVDNHTRVDHLVGPSVSAEEYRYILNDRSRCVFNGKAIVHRGADGTDARQANHNLLLSGEAEIDTKPELEIYADDVKCSHGATVGQLDDAALFYLRSRGLDQDTAARLMTRAFAAEVLALISVDETKSFVGTAVDERLNTLVGEPSGD